MHNYPLLNLPKHPLKLKESIKGIEILDEIRNKYIKLTPEEWVRQNFIHYLINHFNYPKGLIGVEKLVKYNGMNKRADIVIFNKEGKPALLVECKSFKVNITEETFFQVARYNKTLQVKFLILTNGINHYICTLDFEKNQINYLNQIPTYQTICL
jgi:hypothetical protein